MVEIALLGSNCIVSDPDNNFHTKSSHARLSLRISNKKNILIRHFGFLLTASVILLLLQLDVIGAFDSKSRETRKCDHGQLPCNRGNFEKTFCIPAYQRCDMIVDCTDGSDEVNCDYRQCQPDDFKCSDLIPQLCVPMAKKCDGFFDCRHGRDEENCTNVNKPACTLDQFRCNNQQCIPVSYRCDGHPDCKDGSDENGCRTTVCSDNTFTCPMKSDGTVTCIPNLQVCNGQADCPDGADEDPKCSSNNCGNLTCQYKCQASLFGGMCYCADDQILANDSTSCVARNKCAEWGVCDQLCENNNGSFECSCFPGYLMNGTNKCSAASGPPMRLLVAQSTGIFEINSDGKNSKKIVNTPNASGIDYFYSEDTLYWSDLETQTIHSKSLNTRDRNNDSNIGMNIVVDVNISMPVSWSPISMAVDFIGKKLYVVDSIAQKIDVFELNGRGHGILLNTNLTNATDIALDPTVGLMFIADSTQILRANMDGTSAFPVISDAASYNISSVTVDIVAKRIYWTDISLNYIESADYTGANRITILRGFQLPTPSRLAVFENRVYWSDITKNELYSIDKFDGQMSIQTLYSGRGTKAVKVLHPLVQSAGNVKNPCGNNNGGCQHMCLVTAVGDGKSDLDYRCLCEVGWRLKNNSHNCEPVMEFLLYSQDHKVIARPLDPLTEGTSDVILPIVNMSRRYPSVEFDAHNEYIYYSDSVSRAVFRVHRNSSGREVVWTKEKGIVEGLAFDWAANNLYYINTPEGTLNVLSTKNVTYHRTLVKNLKRPRAIAVHPSRGYVFFAVWARPANISRIFTDGSNLFLFKNLTLVWPDSLAIDFEKDRLYWCDAKLRHVQHSNLDGADVRTITSPLLKHAASITIHEQSIYISDWRTSGIIRINKETDDQGSILVQAPPHSRRIYVVKVFSRHLQPVIPDQPCSVNNGGCEKFCFAIPANITNNPSDQSLSRVCGCSNGEKLADDLRTCTMDAERKISTSSCSQQEFTCTNKQCIPYHWFCDGDNDCFDGSDEMEPCVKRTCAPNTFHCKSGECIPEKFHCDSETDCNDNSDEEGCPRVPCRADQFTCADHTCIPKRWKCDLENDCMDGSDEGIFCHNTTTCSSSQFKCRTTGNCIPLRWLCDGENDCLDGSDEMEQCANRTCSPNTFRCKNGQCIRKSFYCDGENDCIDNSDEEGCSGVTCGPDQFTCKNRSCIPKAWKCDSEKDCSDGSDEDIFCNTTCSSAQFTCRTSGICIPLAQLCDGNSDCSDNSDEIDNCTKST